MDFCGWWRVEYAFSLELVMFDDTPICYLVMPECWLMHYVDITFNWRYRIRIC